MSATTRPTATIRASGSKPRRSRFTAWMMTPGVLALAIISVIPVITIIVMSFTNVHMVGGLHISWSGLANWSRIFSDGAFWHSWGITLLYLFFTIGLEVALGTATALALHRFARARSALLPVLLLPMFVAPVIVGLLGRFMTDSSFGLYAWMLRQVGVSGDVLAHGTTAFIAIVMMNLWEWTPLLTLIVLAGLTSINPSIIEAAQLDGASGWRMLRYITLPSIADVLLVGLLIRSMDAIRYFDIITITTNGGPADATKTAPVRLYETAFRFLDLGYASVTGILMIVFTIIVAKGFIKALHTNGASA